MAVPDLAAATAALDYAREMAAGARELAAIAEETLAGAVTGYNQALRQEAG